MCRAVDFQNNAIFDVDRCFHRIQMKEKQIKKSVLVYTQLVEIGLKSQILCVLWLWCCIFQQIFVHCIGYTA